MESTLDAPVCPEHGDAALRLALGELDEPEAGPAETAVRACGACGDWWRRNLEVEAVAEGVAAGLRDFRPDAGRRPARIRWGALAAGLLLVAASPLVWRLAGDRADGESPASRLDGRPAAGPAIARIDFEPAARVLFADDFETVQLSSWSSRHAPDQDLESDDL